ncbi:non-specific serine/threonine protein kinase [Malassezia vespertilionis]|uniref:non-specific serine/threonine protein kinase n=1 Tax=Malassezia vespertilionis TaxID=2020962 RepID=A0A2N1J9H4_9BASI|nr:non-specific serine/threonine protein kinase [Malassezia vespertilionis]PKI83205.1 Mec1p [Malassezia vespertilionis]WFD07691.1 non-specific serine/threonine protein kinase [Malassezia vespertilionis]
MREVNEQDVPAWLRESGILGDQLAGEAREYATQCAARRLVRAYIAPLAHIADAKALKAHLSPANTFSYLDVVHILCTALVAAPRALDTLPAPVPHGRAGVCYTTLDLYLIPRVIAALAVLQAHVSTANSLVPDAQRYSESLTHTAADAVGATMQLLGTALHLLLESPHQSRHARFLLYDALRSASRVLAGAHALPLSSIAVPHELLEPEHGALVLCGTAGTPEAYAVGASNAPCVHASTYVWSEHDTATLRISWSPIVRAAAQCMLFLHVRVAAELAVVFPSALQDLVELGARVLIAHWERGLMPGVAVFSMSHVATPYLALLRYDACVAALPILQSVAFFHILRLCITSFALLFHPVDDAFLDAELGAGPYAAAYTLACERLGDTLRLLCLHGTEDMYAEMTSIVADVGMLRPCLIANVLREDRDVARLGHIFQRCCLALLCLVLCTGDGLREEEAVRLAAFHAPWASAEDCGALQHALNGKGRAPKRRRIEAPLEQDAVQHHTTIHSPQRDDALVHALEACISDPPSPAASQILARIAVLTDEAAHASAHAYAHGDIPLFLSILAPWIVHKTRAVRLAAGRALHMLLSRYAALPRTMRTLDWAAQLHAIVAVATPSAHSDVRIQETCILTVARLGRVQCDEAFAPVAAALVHALYLAHIYLRSLAYTETIQLAARRRCTTFQLLNQHLGPVSRIAVDAMHAAPHGIAEVARLLNMSQQTFLQTTLKHTLPHLVQRIVAGQEAMQPLRAIANAVGQSIPALCLNQTSDIFKHFFMQPEAVRDAALETLLSLLGSRSVTIANLLRSRLHEVLGYLVARLGDAACKAQARAGLEYARSVVTAPPSRWKDADLAEFLRDEVLAILTWINEELGSVHGKISMAQRVVTARSVGELVKLIGAVAARVAPQVMACLHSTLTEPELALPTLESWLDFFEALRYQDVGPFVGQTAAAFLAIWPRLAADEKEKAQAILRYTIVDNGEALHAFIDDVPSLDAIEHDIPDIARHLRSARRVWVDDDHLRHILERVAHDNAAVCVQSLRELSVFLRERRACIETWTSGNVFHPLIGQCVHVLLAVAGRTESPAPDVQALCLECLGILGAVDPDRFELSTDEPFFVLLSNFEDAHETVSFATRLLVDLVVPAFRATSDTKHQAALAYTIQELLKICGFTPALLDTSAKGVPERVMQRWEALPEAMLPTLMPLLNSKYVVQCTDQRRRPSPIYRHSNSFRDWIQAWVLQLILGLHDQGAMAVFSIFRSVVRDNDVTIAHDLLPHLVLHTLISGTLEQRRAVLDEINCVLTDQVHPSVGYAPERRRLTTQTMFHVMDHVGHWMRRVRLMHSRSSRRGHWKEALADVQSVMDNISQERMAQASLQCHAYTRSLLNFEYRIRDLRQLPDTTPQQQRYLETVHEIYANLDDPDGMEGISTCVFAPSLEHQIREHESTGRWTDAQSCWEVELQQRPDDAHLHLGLLRCLRSLGHYDTLRTHIRGLLSVHPDWQPQFASFQIEGACILADWEAVRSLVHQSHQVPELAMARALLAMRENSPAAFSLAVHDARMQLGQPLLGPGSVSYTHGYDAMTQLQMLHELEMVFHASQHDASRIALEKSLEARFSATLPSFRTREPVLSLRRSALQACAASRAQIGQAWVLTAKTARRAKHAQTAYSAVLQALQCGAPYAFVQKAKLLAQSDQVQAALQELGHSLAARDKLVGEGGTDASAADRRTLAKAHLLRARLVEDTARFQQNDIIQQYKTCTSLDPDSEKIWYNLGHFYDSPSGGPVGNQMLLQLSVCRFYMKSAQNGTKYLYRTLPRMLTIWLDAGNELVEQSAEPAPRTEEDARQTQLQFDKINDMMRKSVRHLARYQWFAVFPQLVARIVHKNEAVWQVLLEIIVAVLVSYPQQSMWALIAGSHAKDKQRKQRYERIVERVSGVPERAYRDVLGIIRAFEQLSTELLNLCEYHVGKETTLSMQRQFGALLPTVQNTPLILPLQSSVNVTLPPTNTVDQHHHPFPADPPTIEGFDDTIEIMHSLQKPRKIVVHASNGMRYPFLCKPRDDLRKDARLIEFDSMINKLLQSSSESRRRRLYIRTYAVLILNEECGLIEWVPNTVAYRTILAKHYAVLDTPLYTADLKGIMDEARMNPKHTASIFEERILTRYPPVFHAWFLETFPEPGAWFRARSAYARTAAVMSIVGFVLGLGDRHGDNILFDAGSGDTVHVDLNCLFDKGSTFEIPERVPFRLTQNMVDALGVTGVEGAFRRTAEVTMHILRANKESLMSVLQAMVHDPLGEWLVTERRARHKLGEKHSASLGARKALASVSDKLDGKLRRPGISDEVRHTTKNLVHMLICDATSNQNLGQMYIGWAPYL